MARRESARAFELSRRDFLITTGGALAGMAAFGLVDAGAAGKRDPQRRGTLLYGSSIDAGGLDAHTHNQNHTVVPTTVMYTGLTDLDQRGNIVPGIAESWEPNPEITAWTFRLRKGVVCQTGSQVGAGRGWIKLRRSNNP